ncbi:MAG: carboxypeptidase regulatory-like domain-containing protein [Elusimicrobia bacterium]|jgi:type II secretory pathway pseudopilin PulG|nr:carboxypeptidase regulatory-like domain-containing protein [Elusimicrobiota bacterium]
MVTGRPIPRTTAGVTLIELLVMSVIASLVGLTVIQGFSGISRGIIATRFKSLATQLANEKMQSLKNTSYYRLRVSSHTVVPTALSALSPSVWSDESNYSPTVSIINGVTFTAYAMVERVKKNASETLDLKAWDSTDTGLKRITLDVVWRERDAWKRFQLTNLLENPNRGESEGDFVGTVTDNATATPLSGAMVDIAENPSMNAVSGGTGNYRLGVRQGTYTLRASKPGYFTKTSANNVISSTTTQVTVNFALNAMSSGTISGSVWHNDHLVISRVCGYKLTGPTAQEYVEIFNPTTWTWTVDGAIGLTFQRRLAQDPWPIPIALNYAPGGSLIPPGKFYLFASQSVLNIDGTPVSADAVWNTTIGGAACNTGAVVNDDCFPYFDAGAGVYNILPTNGTDGAFEGAGVLTLTSLSTGMVLDRVGWQGAGWNNPASSETLPVSDQFGLQANEIYYRKSDTGGALSSTVGPAYDSGNNSLDWAVNNGAPHSPPRASASPALPVRTGIPSNGALIFADDGLSQMTQAALTGSPPEARFTLSSVATGTWTVSASSGNFFLSFSTPIGAGVNLSTSVVMNTSTLYGFASGRVVDALGLGGLAGISISPGVGLTNGLGFFNVPLFPGAQTLTANKGSTNPNYTETSLPITIVRGQSSSNHTLYLSGGARIQGLLTIDGVTPLPNVPVEVTNVGTGMTMDNAISNPSGLFSVSVPVGTYAVRPTVEFGESISPDTPAVNANVGGSTVFAATYTVTSAYGTLTGKVTHQGKPITTGVLLMASVVAVPASPPPIDSSFRGSGTLYYSGSSRSDGTYSFKIQNGTYFVTGWYTTFNGNTPTVTRKDLTNVVIAPRTTTTRDIAW